MERKYGEELITLTHHFSTGGVHITRKAIHVQHLSQDLNKESITKENGFLLVATKDFLLFVASIKVFLSFLPKMKVYFDSTAV